MKIKPGQNVQWPKFHDVNKAGGGFVAVLCITIHKTIHLRTSELKQIVPGRPRI